jgi:hypothetical protein
MPVTKEQAVRIERIIDVYKRCNLAIALTELKLMKADLEDRVHRIQGEAQ